jgi:hypothetical protein
MDSTPNEIFKVTCRQCGCVFETGDEDDTVMQLCPDCLDGPGLGNIGGYGDDWVYNGGFDYD